MSSGRRVLTAEDIFICDDLPREWVATPEWRASNANGDECGVYVCTLDAVEKEKWEEEYARKIGIIMSSALSRACVNENGDRIFTGEQIEKLSKKSGLAVSRLWQVFRKLNVVTDADVNEQAKN